MHVFMSHAQRKDQINYYKKISEMEAQANLVLTRGFELLPKAKLLRRHDFPQGFIFGTASSAYQYEGAWKLRGKNIWDTFTHDHPEKIADLSNGDVADDFYHQYKNDVKLMKELGQDAFRFSISWSRVLPCGKLSKGVNEKGIKFYSDLIDDLMANGLQPFVTLFHWDVPQALEYEYGGFLSPQIVDDFRDFAELCFVKFGDRVKNWITLNEPWSFSFGGYAAGFLAPGRCSTPSLLKDGRNFFVPYRCATFRPSRTPQEGDSGTEPYLVTHYQLLAHAAAVKLYKQKYQACQKGQIGITLISQWFEPLTESVKDRAAAIRSLDFMFGWFMDPLTNGYYPHTMQALVGNRLPKFSKEESEMVKGSFDFLGLNYYTARYAQDALPVHFPEPSYITDPHVNLLSINHTEINDLDIYVHITLPFKSILRWPYYFIFVAEKDGKPIGPQAGSHWLYVYPQGIKDLLLYTKNRYHDPLIYITENGVDEKKDGKPMMDYTRVDYHSTHLSLVRSAIREGVNVKGYFAWSLLDNFEWCEGYTVRFGIYYVDYDNGLRRYPKLSSLWFQYLLKNKGK